MKNLARKLKEFDLDAPTLSKETRSAFRRQTRFLTASVERNFTPFSNTVGAWKVLIEVVPTITKSQVRNLLGALTIQVAGDAETYLRQKDGERERIALAWLLTGARAIFSENEWPSDDLERAVQAVIDANFQSVLKWKSNVRNPANSATVDVVVEMGAEQARIIAKFQTRGSDQIQVSTLCVADPSEFAFVPRLGKLIWLNDDTIQLTSQNGLESWKATRH